MPKKLEKCVKSVKKSGKDESSAYAICTSQTGWKVGKGSTKYDKKWVKEESEFDKFVNELLKDYDDREVKSGLEIEKEHDDVTKGDKLKRAKIAAAHLKENPRYYQKLKRCVE